MGAWPAPVLALCGPSRELDHVRALRSSLYDLAQAGIPPRERFLYLARTVVAVVVPPGHS